MRAVFRKIFVMLTMASAGVLIVMFAVANDRSKRRREDEAEKLSTLLGTVYPKKF